MGLFPFSRSYFLSEVPVFITFTIFLWIGKAVLLLRSVMKMKICVCKIFLLVALFNIVACSDVETQLFEDLMYNYNKVARPVRNSSDLLTIAFEASLIRIIDIDEKNQVFTTNVWLGMQWTDSKLIWSPEQYGDLEKLHIPAEWIWTPDIVLYNNAAGDPEITIYNDALVYADGTVIWKPPAIYKSFCSIDVTWFPYDTQECEMMFIMWTYTAQYVDLRQADRERLIKRLNEQNEYEEHLEHGMDLSYFYESAEWDLLKLSSVRHEKVYPGCCGIEKYVDITYKFKLRRKTLFFTVNLIIPCFLISFLTTFVFYLSDHKITFAISILVTLTVFFLVLIDIIPPTSTVIPMCAKYLLFTMILVTLSIVISVISVNFHFRRGSTHKMPPWMRKVFLDIMPRYMWPCVCTIGLSIADYTEILRMKRPIGNIIPDQAISEFSTPSLLEGRRGRNFLDDSLHRTCVPTAHYLSQLEQSHIRATTSDPILETDETAVPLMDTREKRRKYRESKTEPVLKPDDMELHKKLHSRLITHLLRHVQFIADHFCAIDDDEQEASDWCYVAMVIDRLFLILYAFFNLGTLFIILRAPSLYDTTEPLAIPERSKPLGQDTLGSFSPRLGLIMHNNSE